jgi:hypothetical protein
MFLRAGGLELRTLNSDTKGSVAAKMVTQENWTISKLYVTQDHIEQGFKN